MNELLVVLLTVLGVVVLYLLSIPISGGSFGRLGLACQAYMRALRDEEFAKKIAPLLTPPKPVEQKPSGAPLRLLAVLQRESRLVDFLMDNLKGASDDQIAAAVRDIQPKSQATLKKYLVVESVIAQAEGETVEVAAGFDPSAIQVVGNVTGEPPFRGELKHAGWRVKEIHLAPLPEGHDEFVLAPAEVEIP